MNEQIDKLIVKAGAYFGAEGVDYSNFDPKKFAKLIVQECVDKLEKEKFEHFSINRVGREHYNYGLTAGAIAIKQHFRVKR